MQSVHELLAISASSVESASLDTSPVTLDTSPVTLDTSPVTLLDNALPISGPSTFIDVHTFDYSYQQHNYQVDHNVTEMTNDEKRDWIVLLRPRLQPMAVHGLDLILANIGMPANFDTTNQKRAEDILVMLSKHVIQCDSSFLSLVDEQLQDMLQLGQCAQGRTTRLWQLYCSLPKNECLIPPSPKSL